MDCELSVTYRQAARLCQVLIFRREPYTDMAGYSPAFGRQSIEIVQRGSIPAKGNGGEPLDAAVSRDSPMKPDMKLDMDRNLMPGTAIASDDSGRSVAISVPMDKAPDWATRLTLSMEDYVRLLGATANKID